MKPHEPMKEAAGEQRESIVSDIADRLHLSPSTVYKWTQPSEDPTDSGQRGPLAILQQFMESCLILGRPRSAALSPLSYLNRHFDQVVFSVPSHIKSMAPEELSAELIRCMKEFGDVVRTYQEAAKKNGISKQEMKRIEREVWEAVTEMLTFLHCVQEAGR